MSKLVDLQTAIVNRLAAIDPTVPSLVPANGAIRWITEDVGDLANIITRATAKLGIVGIVMTPGGGKLFKTGEPGIAFQCPIEIQIQENVVINRGTSGTQIAALALVEFVMKRLNFFSPTNQRITRITLDETPYLLVSEYPILTYNVRFNAPLTIV